MLEQQLTTQAAEIAAAGHAGWGNTMLDAAAELAALRKDAERWRWWLHYWATLATAPDTIPSIDTRARYAQCANNIARWTDAEIARGM
jgi:hypothetical protein